MQLKILRNLVAATLLLARPGVSQDAPLIPPVVAPAMVAEDAFKPLDLPSNTFSFHLQTLPPQLNWQQAPDGVGEILPFRNPPSRDSFAWGKHRLIGTSLGLLSSETENRWRVAPVLYAQAVRIVGEFREVLWVESRGQGLVALNQDLEIVRRLPSVKGQCVAIETQGFWCLDDFQEGFGAGSRASALVEYGANGQERRRFVVQEGALVVATPGKMDGFYPVGGIAWASVGEDAIWVSTNNYGFGGIGGNDLPQVAGTERLGRLDRATGKFTAVEWPPPAANPRSRSLSATQFINFPDKIQWLSSNGDDWDVYQLDKKMLQVNRPLKILAPDFYVTTKGKNLWLQKRGADRYSSYYTRVYDRQTLNAVPVREAGEAPGEIAIDADNSSFWMKTLACDESGLWLSAPERSMVTLRDDGQSANLELAVTMEHSHFASKTPSGVLFWFSDERLRRTQADGATKFLNLADVWKKTPDDKEPVTLDSLVATERRVWFHTNRGQMVTLKSDLSEPHEIAPNPLFSSQPLSRSNQIREDHGVLAVGDFLYVWAESGDLLRVDGTNGKVEVIESWTRGAEANATPPRRDLGKRAQSSVVLPDGRIAFSFAEIRDILMMGPAVGMNIGQLDKPHLFLYDSTKDSWQESPTSAEVHPLSAGKNLFGYDATQLFQWRKNGWVAIGKRPLSRPVDRLNRDEFFGSDLPVNGTEKYCYQETALGLYRVAWAEVGGQ